MKTPITLLVLLMLCGIFSVSAQDKKPASPDAIKNFMRLQGKWDSEATVTINGKTHFISYHIAVRRVADGSGFFMDEWFNDSTLGSMKGANMFGYNAEDKKVHWFSVDNMGTCHEHVGEWKDANHFSMKYDGMSEGKKFSETVEMAFKSDVEMDLKMVRTLDGKEVERDLGTFIKNVPIGIKK